MGRPRRYATNAEKQAAYRARKGPVTKNVLPGPVLKAVAKKTLVKEGCSAYVPHGTKCKLCGKVH